MIRSSEAIQDVIVDLLRQARSRIDDRPWLLGDAEKLSQAVTSIPQRTLARRTGRSAPAIRRLVQAGVLRAATGGRVVAIDAAMVELALSDVPRGGRSLMRHVAASADWMNEYRDPGFRLGLQQARDGELVALKPAAGVDEENRLLRELEETEHELPDAG